MTAILTNMKTNMEKDGFRVRFSLFLLRGSRARQHARARENCQREGRRHAEGKEILPDGDFRFAGVFFLLCERFEPRNTFISRLSIIVRVYVVLSTTVVDRSD